MDGTARKERDLYLSNPDFAAWLVARTGLDPQHQSDESIWQLYSKWHAEKKEQQRRRA
jgi:hypothetical protein